MNWAEIKLALNSTALTPDMKPLDLLLLEQIEKLNDKIDAIRNNSALVGDDLAGKKIRVFSIRDVWNDTVDNDIIVLETNLGNSIVCDNTPYYQGNGVFNDIFDTSTIDERIYEFAESETITKLNKKYIQVMYVN